VLKTFGLGCALQQFAEDHGLAGCHVELTISGDEPDIPLTRRLSLHQVLLTLIHRIRQHAAASKLDVICIFDPARVEVLIEHDGADVMNRQSQDQATLAGVRGRIALLGARLLVSRNTDQGLRRVRLVIPLPPKDTTA
jgi:glucose-6-phosphate-specific signal transduction histidine kinase